ncbi:MAG: response regulator transcription factor [Oscillospiraceae bacterium]|nr:response regulator transcription factor [Oscillospiraceae bacterium]
MIKLLIAEDIPTLLNRYRKACEADAQISVVAAVRSGYEAVMMATMHRPDVVLMDIQMETPVAGFAAARQILAHFPDTKIVILTILQDEEAIFQAFALGAVDYILKGASSAELVQCVKDAYHNCSPIRPVIAETIRREFRRVKAKEDGLMKYLNVVVTLTMSELSILDLFHQGKTRADVCRIRNVEMSTVKSQVNSILRKFECATISELLAMLDKVSFFDNLSGLRQILGRK